MKNTKNCIFPKCRDIRDCSVIPYYGNRLNYIYIYIFFKYSRMFYFTERSVKVHYAFRKFLVLMNCPSDGDGEETTFPAQLIGWRRSPDSKPPTLLLTQPNQTANSSWAVWVSETHKALYNNNHNSLVLVIITIKSIILIVAMTILQMHRKKISFTRILLSNKGKRSI